MGNENSQETIDAVDRERIFFRGLLQDIGKAAGVDMESGFVPKNAQIKIVRAIEKMTRKGEVSQETKDAIDEERRLCRGMLVDIGKALGDQMSDLRLDLVRPRIACDSIIAQIVRMKNDGATAKIQKRTTVLARISKCERDIASLRELVGE